MDETDLNEVEAVTPEAEHEVSPADAVVADMGLDEQEVEVTVPETPEPEESAEEPAEEAAEPAEEPAKITDDDLTPLASGNKATQERFRKVTEGYKEERQRAEALSTENARYKESFDALRSLGFTDEAAAQDLVALSEYRNILATGDVEMFNKVIGNQIREFESLHGKKASIQASALDNFADLKDKVENLEIDEETALELARSRNLQQRAQRDQTARNEERVKTETSQQEINNAVGAIEDMQANWQKLDPDYAAILPHLKEQMPQIGKEYPAHMWPSIIDMQYKTLKRALISAAASKQTAQPIRGGGAGAASRAVPKNPQDAALLEMGFDIED